MTCAVLRVLRVPCGCSVVVWSDSQNLVCLAHELRRRGLAVRVQVPVPILYDGIRIGVGYRIDLLVEERVVVELKVVRKLHPVHEAQLLSYLKLSRLKLGLLINFHVVHLRDGIKRIVNGLQFGIRRLRF